MKELRPWDRRVDASPGVALYEAFEEALWRRTFADEMSAAALRSLLPLRGERAVRRPARRHRGSPVALVRRSLHAERGRNTRRYRPAGGSRRASPSLRARFGAPRGWRWDEAHAVKFSHPLSGGGRVLDWFFSRGPVPVGGDSMTVNKTTTNLRRPYETSEAASYRQILDVGAWDASLGVNTTGQSGHPLSPALFRSEWLVAAGTVSRSAVYAPGGRGRDGFTTGVGSVGGSGRHRSLAIWRH